MSVTLQSAPPVEAPKASAFAKLEPFPDDGPTMLTIVAYNYIPAYTFTPQTGEPYSAPAIEFYFGAETAAGARFIKTWPKAYSIRNTSFYHKIFRAALGKEPTAGSKPDELIGHGVQATITNKEKTSRKGTKYRASEIDLKSVAPVHPKLKGEIAPVKELLPKLKAVLASNDDKAAEPDSNDNPF